MDSYLQAIDVDSAPQRARLPTLLDDSPADLLVNEASAPALIPVPPDEDLSTATDPIIGAGDSTPEPSQVTSSPSIIAEASI